MNNYITMVDKVYKKKETQETLASYINRKIPLSSYREIPGDSPIDKAKHVLELLKNWRA